MYSYFPPNVNAFETGDEIEVLQMGDVVEEGIVITSDYNEITIRTLDDRTESFGHKSGWSHLFKDPFTNGRCYSQNAMPLTLRIKVN